VKVGAERRQRAVSKKGQPVGVAVLSACGLSADNVGPAPIDGGTMQTRWRGVADDAMHDW
jgi:hypothetical protein